MHLKIILLIIVCSNLLNAQSPYEFNWKKESVYLGIGGGSLLASRFVRVAPLTLSEIMDLKNDDIKSYDKGAELNLSSSAKRTSDILFIGSVALGGSLLLKKESRSNWKNLMLLYGETFLMTAGVTNLTKHLAKKERPFVYNELSGLDIKQTINARLSFFSGHTSITAANTFFVAKVFSDYYPKNKWRYFIWSSAIVIPAVTGYMRVKAGQHFNSDVIVGYAVGGLIGYFVPHFHRVKGDKTMSLEIAPGGFRLVKKF